MTDLEFQAWLEQPSAIRGLFVEITVKDLTGIYGTAGTEVVIYISTTGYITKDSLVSFNPVIANAISLTESISIDGSTSFSFGDIEVNNASGELDSWLDNTKFVWVNRSIKVYLGDPFWATDTLAAFHAKFVLVFDGVVTDIDSRSRETLNIKVNDKLQRLNTALTENKLGTYGTWAGGQPNQDTIKPLVFGEVFNITPLSIDPSKLEYMFNDGEAESVIEIRSNGIPIYNTIGVTAGPLCTATVTGTNIITCASTNKLVPGKPVVFAGTVFGNIVAGTTYYIKSIVSVNQFTVSATVDGVNLVLSTASGSMTTDLIRAAITNSTGKFTLYYPPAAGGACTMSVQGVKKSVNLTTGALESTYRNNIASLIALIVTQYGKTDKFTVNDLDIGVNSNLLNFSTTYTQAVGTYISDRSNILTVCQELASSVGAQLFINRKGKLQLLRLEVPTTTPSFTITDNEILHHSLSISNKTSVVAATSIGYVKNWTVQTDLITAIPTVHKTNYETEWYSKTIVDTAVQSTYVLSAEPVQKDTMLITGVDAAAEALRLNNYFKVPKIVYSFTGTSKLLSLILGQSVILKHNRFGLVDGKAGQVISLSPNWIDSTITVEVII